MGHRPRQLSKVEAWYLLPLACFTLFGFAVAQPLFDLLARNPIFLLQHEAGHREAAWLIASSWLLPGLAAAVLISLLRLLSSAAARAGFALFFFVAVAATVSPLLRSVSPDRPWVAVALAAVLALWRSASFRGALAVGALAPILFSIVFVARPGIRGVLDPPRPPGALELRTHGELKSVILVILDELPLTNLLSAMNEIDAERYPNLAAFREDSVWFRNCATVSGATERSIPAILTGRYVRSELTPDLAHYPENLVTLLAHDMLVVAHEGVTHLSPPKFERHDPMSRAHRMDLLLSDSAVLLLHRILPPKLARSVPQIDTGWAGFGRAQDVRGGRVGKFLNWVQRLQRGFKPTLGVIHIVLPHSPYVYYADATQYSDRFEEPFKYGGRWLDDAHPVSQAWMRARLQLQTTDGLIGALVHRLRELGLYDDAVIAITADHGASFRPGDFYRRISDSNLADLAAVPWFLKLPGQARAGDLDERLVITTDILPTLAEAAGFEVPWETDGRSFLRKDEPGRESALFFDLEDATTEHPFTLADLAGQEQTLWRQIEAFAQTPPGGRSTSVGTYAGLVAAAVSELEIGEPSEFKVRLADQPRAASTRPGSTFLPGEIHGWILASRPMHAPVDLALCLRDSVVAVTQSVTGGEAVRAAEWLALIPRRRLLSGSGGLRLYAIDSGSRLHPLERTGAQPSVLGQRLGIAYVEDVELRGIYADTRLDGEGERWTAPNASLSIPLRADDRPARLRIAILRPAVPSAHMVITAAGDVLFDGQLEEEPWEREFRLDPDTLALDRPFVVELNCDASVADDAGRARAVLLSGVWLLD